MRSVPQWCTSSQECRCVKDLHSEWEFMLTALQRSTAGGTPMQIKPQLTLYLTPSLARSLHPSLPPSIRPSLHLSIHPTGFLNAHQEFCLISLPLSITHLLPIIISTLNFDVLLVVFVPLYQLASLYLRNEAFYN